MKPYRNPLLVAAMVVVVVSAAATYTSTPQSAGSASALGASPAVDVIVNDNLSWDDDRAHLVVLTANGVTDAADQDGEPTPSAIPGGEGGPSRPAHSAGGTEVTVVRADGTSETIVIPTESMTAVFALNVAEQTRLDASPAGALLVVDALGVAGPAGERYILAGSLLTELGAGTVGAAVASDQVIAQQISALDGVGSATVVGPGIIAVVADATDPAMSASIGAVDGVTSVADDVLFSFTSDPLQGTQWALENTGRADQAGGWPGVVGADIAAAAAWTVANGSNVTVAVVDSGVQLTHPDLASQIWVNVGETCANGIDDDHDGFIDDCNGWDFGNGDKNPNPDAGVADAEHGTHVSGIIAAASNGVGTVGVAPGAKIMALKVANAAGGISGAAVAAAIDYATAKGAKVINLSIGTQPGTPRAAIASIETAIANATSKGVVVVAGAGNNGIDITTATVWPAGLSVYNSGVITAGASTNADTRASFSNIGAPVSLMAPGWWIMSTVLNGQWAFMSGTSMASPYVAGSAAVLVSSGIATTPAAVRSRLVATADPTPSGPRLNVGAAVGVARTAVAPAGVSVSYSGTAAMVPDTPGLLGLTVTAGATSGITQMRLSVATRESGGVVAVEGLTASFADIVGPIATAATGDQGAFPMVPIRDTAGLHSSGALVNAALAFPGGDYAMVTEMFDAAGANVGGAQVVFVTISSTVGTGAGEVSATSVAANPIPTDPAGGATATTALDGAVATTSPVPGGSGTAPPATAPATDGTSPATAPPPGDGAAPTTAPSLGTEPVTSSAGAPDTTASPPSGASDSTATTTPTVTAPGAPPGVPTTTPATAPPGAAPPPTTATTTPTSAPAPPTTIPPPAPVTQGVYALTSMTPRISSMCGGTQVSLTGVFPINVAVYVWFGADGPIATATGSAHSLDVSVPAVLTARVVDVSVKFAVATTYVMTLVNAFTFTDVAEGCGATPASTTTTLAAGPAPATTVAGGASATTAPVSGSSPPSTAPPSSSAPPPGTTPGTTATTTATTSPSGGSASSGPAIVGSRGTLTLRAIAAGGALAGLAATTWPATGCRQVVCPATRL